MSEQALAAYARFYETLSPGSLESLRRLVAPQVRFKDPFNEVRGIDSLLRVTSAMFRYGTPRFEIIDRALSGRAGYLLWRYTVDVNAGKPWIIDGMSELRFDAQGLVVEHIDHWDAAEQFYERLPLLGALLRLVKRRLHAG